MEYLLKHTSNQEQWHDNRLSLVRMRDLTKILSVSKSMIYLWLNPSSKYFRADFPRPVRIGSRLVAWRAAEIESFICSLLGSVSKTSEMNHAK